MHLSEPQLLFLARFAKSPDGREFLELYRAELAEVEKALRVQVGEELYRQQGHAQRLDKLIADITGASAKLTASQSAQRAPRRFALTDGLAA
jgi:hypothetical protein